MLTLALRCAKADTILACMATEPAIGTAIKRARERRRWTQRELADALGVDIKSVDNWENGRTRPRNRIGAIEEVLGISFDGQPAPGPLDDLLPVEEEWEAGLLQDARLPDDLKRQTIVSSRAARAAADARRAQRAAREAG